MVVKIVGYNKVEYSTSEGDHRIAYSVFCLEDSESEKYHGSRVERVFCSGKYFEDKILPAKMSLDHRIHVGWEKDTHRPFLYAKEV